MKYPFAILSASVVGLFLILGCLLLGKFGLTQEAGWFGDLFGSINALFSALAFAAVAYTMVLQSKQLYEQQKQLKIQQEELQLTRAEASRAATAQEASQVALSQQVDILVLTAYLNATVSMHDVRARETTARTGYEDEISKMRQQLQERLSKK